MREYLKNKEYKKETLKRLIGDLHKGRSFEEVKREFQQLVDGVDSVEIADLEQELIAEGLSPEEIKRLCDVHAALFREALARNEQVELPEGHPLLALKTENDEARKALAEIEAMLDRLPEDATGQGTPLERLRERIARFGKELDSHYRKKENLFFPYLEKHNVTGPPAVMWAVDDEIRRMLKDFSALLEKATADQEDPGKIRESFVALRDKITEMFSKEEDILIPMLKNTLSEAEWAEIREQMEGKETAAPYRSGSGNGIALDTGNAYPRGDQCRPYQPPGGCHLCRQERRGALFLSDQRKNLPQKQVDHRPEGAELPPSCQRACG